MTGVELYSDLCLADALLHYGLADEVVFHGKPFPWFVSDVTRDDFDETLAICLAEAPAGAQASGRRSQGGEGTPHLLHTSRGEHSLPMLPQASESCPGHLH